MYSAWWHYIVWVSWDCLAYCLAVNCLQDLFGVMWPVIWLHMACLCCDCGLSFGHLWYAFHDLVAVLQYFIVCHSWGCVCSYSTTSRPCRTLFGYCPPPALGSRKADMKTLSFFFPTPYPCHFRASSYQAQTSWAAELPVPVPCTHFFLCPEYDNGWVRWRNLLIPTDTSK